MQTDTRNGIRTPHNDNGRVGTGALTAISPKTGGVFPPLPVPQGDAGAGGFAPTACKRLRRQRTPSRPLACAYPRKRGTETLPDRKSTRLNSSHLGISYAVFC